jgi:hypothetical protein
MFAFGAIIVIVHLILINTVFKYETPKYSLFVSHNDIELRKTLSIILKYLCIV